MIHVEYFAVLKDKSGIPGETLELLPGDTGRSVYDRLKSRYAFPLSSEDLRLAIHDEFSDMDVVLKPGDRVVYIPPVAGG